MIAETSDSISSRKSAQVGRCLYCGAENGVSGLPEDYPFVEDELGDDDAVWPAAIPLPLLLGVLLLPRFGPMVTAVAVASVSAVEIALIVVLRRRFIRRRPNAREDLPVNDKAPVPAVEIRDHPESVRNVVDLRPIAQEAFTPAAPVAAPPLSSSAPAPAFARAPGPAADGLDEDRLAHLRRDSEQARQTLQAWNVAADEESPPAAPSLVAPPPHDSTAASNSLVVLDDEERQFAVAVAQRSRWSSEELSGLARLYGLMKDAAIDRVNEASLSLFAVVVLTESPAGIDVDIDTLRRSLSQSA